MIEVYINNKPLKTPKGASFKVPNEQVAKAIEEEWENDQAINYLKKPLTALVATAIDQVSEATDTYIFSLLEGLGADALLYWEPSPDELVALQEEKWLPSIEQINADFGTNLKESLSVSPLELETKDKAKFQEWLSRLSDYELTVFSYLHTLLGSFICTYLLFQGRIDGNEAYALAFLHQNYQQGIWGIDSEVQEKIRQTKAEIDAAAHFLKLQ